MAKRTERDALGARDLPVAALYGLQTARAMDSLAFSGRSLASCPAYLQALLAVKQAAARANLNARLFDERIAGAIESACKSLRSDAPAEAFPVDLFGGGGSIAINMNVNEVIANLANEELGGQRGRYSPIDPKQHVNASQSTADVCHTALRLALLRQWPSLSAAIAALLATLERQQRELAEIPTLARTCLQDAMPTHLGFLFGGYAALVARRSREIDAAVVRLRTVSLGGTVIGSGDGAPPRYRKRVVPMLAAITGLDLRAAEHPADLLQNSDDVAQISAQLALLAQALIKLCQDLRLLASGPRGGFHEIVLPHVLAGSSFFSDKRNPVIPETVMQCAFQVLGCDRAVQAAVEHGELYLNVFDGLAAVNVLDALKMLARAVDLLDQLCLRGLQANQARCRELASFGESPPRNRPQ